MAAMTWYGRPETFAKYANLRSAGFTNEQCIHYEGEGTREALPPGSLCVFCGNTDVKRSSDQYFCEACSTIGKIKIVKSERYPELLVNSVEVILPPSQ